MFGRQDGDSSSIASTGMMCAGASFGIGKTGTIERNKQKRQDCKINATLQKIKCGKHSASNLDGDSFKFGLSS